MKSFFKKIALVLALAMVVTMLPAKVVSAADAEGPQLAKQVKLYIGGDKSESYSDTAYAKVWNKAGYTVEFSSDNEAVATVGKRKGLVTAVSVGSATITAVFTSEDGETVTKTCPVVVKKNAVAVGISANSAKELEAGIAVGETYQPKVYRTSADDVTSWKGKDVITDGARFESSNEEIFTVKKTTGKITAVAVGEAKLSVWTVQSEKPEKDENGKVVEYLATTEKVEYTVNVVAPTVAVTGVTVKSVTEIELAVTGVTAENVGTLKITNVNGGDITSLFSPAKLSEDGKTVTVSKYFNLANDEELTFAFGDGEGFTYTVKVGEAVAIVIDEPETVVVGVATDIKYRVIDANGIDLGVTSAVLDVTDKTYAMVSGGKITMYQAGQTATVTAVYNTGKLDANYMPIELKTEKTVTCVEASAITSKGITFGVGASFNDVKDNLSADAISMYKGNVTYRLFAQVALSAGDPENNANIADSRFTFEALTPSVLLVEARTGYLTPVSVGTARVLVKYNDGLGVTATGVATIYVREDQKVVSIVPDKTGVVLSNKDTVEDFVTITMTGTDQYGNTVKTPSIAGVDAVDWPGKNDPTPAPAKGVTIDSNTVTFEAANATAGTYVYRVKHNNDVTAIVTISVRTPEATVSSYKILVDGNQEKLEIKPSEITDPAKTTISFRIVGLDRYGIATSVVTPTESPVVKVDDNNKADVAPGANGRYVANFVAQAHTEAPLVASGDAVIVTVEGSSVGYTVKTGSFQISASYAGRNVVPATVAVSLIETAAPEVKIPTSVVAAATKANYQAEVEKLFEVDADKYEAPYIVWNSDDVADPIKDVANPNGQSFVFVRNIKVYEKKGNVLVLHTVAVNRYISVTINN